MRFLEWGVSPDHGGGLKGEKSKKLGVAKTRLSLRLCLPPTPAGWLSGKLARVSVLRPSATHARAQPVGSCEGSDAPKTLLPVSDGMFGDENQTWATM